MTLGSADIDNCVRLLRAVAETVRRAYPDHAGGCCCVRPAAFLAR
jgi:hypothetical protein